MTKPLRPLTLPFLALILTALVGMVVATASPAAAQVGAPPVTNIAVCNGPQAGEVVISWDSVPQATYYRIGYVNMVKDYPLAKASATGEWIEAFAYVDVNARNIPVTDGRGQYTLRRLVRGDRHAFTVLTSDDVVNTRETISGAYSWPQNPRWKFLEIASPDPNCAAAAPPTDAEPRVAPMPETPAPVPPVANIAVCNGPGVGEVVISWDSVSQAAYYRIGYVNMVKDYPRTKASATGEWIEAFIYVDVNARNIPVTGGRGQYTLRRLVRGDRHAFTVLTSNNVVNTRETISGAYSWPQNPRWKFLEIASPDPNCAAPPTVAATPCPAYSPGAAAPRVTLDASVISLTERDDATDITVTATLARAAAADTTITLALQEDAPLLTPGVRSITTAGRDYTTTLGASNRIITIPAGATTAQATFQINPTYDTAAEGDEAIVLTGATVGGTVTPTDVILEDGPYLAFPKYIYGRLLYPGEQVSVTVAEAINQAGANSRVSYALTGTEPGGNPLGLTFDPATRRLTGTAPAAAAVPADGLTTRYTITARDGAGHTATTLVSVAVVNDVCSSTKAGWFHATDEPPAELVTDCNVLLAARDTLRGTGTLNWATDTDIANWHGLAEFHTDVKWIRKIELQLRRLDGTIPPVLGHLASPGSLDLVLGGDWRATDDALENKLTGPIPPELGLPSNMVVLALSYNNLSGPIPRELANNGRLRFLYLHDTDKPADGAAGPTPPGVSGPIPPEFSEAPMRGLSISGNPGVTGHIPWQLGKLVSKDDYPGLQVLNLYDNSLEGNVPWQLGRFGKIQQLGLTGNQLTGRIPWQLGRLGNEEAALQRRVVRLYLNRNQLSGEIPPRLADIANLAVLSLSNNRLSGAIPPELSRLPKLQHLFLNRNELSGEIPPELCSLANLTRLRLHSNQLSGKIPPVLTTLANLTDLRLNNNQLSGEIPPELGNLTNLTSLSLGGNQLSGEIPPELGALANLTWLNLAGNRLSGEIPAELGSLANLTSLGLQDNRLSGGIPPELGRLASLILLSLYDNQLSGRIPPELGNLASLTDLNLYNNQLSGELPPALSNLASLMDLRLQGNRLSGELPPWLADLATLERLYLSYNRLSGELPPELGRLANLTSLWLDNNRLSGDIPPELASLANLTVLRLNNNRLSGEIPPWLGRLANLTVLRLSTNQLDGVIPVELSNLANLTELTLSNNGLSGEIPVELSNLANLTALHLGGNQLSGEIPPWLGDLANLTALRLNLNQLDGEIPVELASLANLTQLWLQENRLSEEIPPELGRLANLTDLRLGANRLSGRIPPELGRLVNLTVLWLHNNRLSGEIPPELGRLVNLRDLWLHENQLSGEIPPELLALASRGELWLSSDLLRREAPDGPVPVRVAAGSGTPSGEPVSVALTAAFGGREFSQPVEIGAYPVGPSGGPGSGLLVAELDGRILLLGPGGDRAVNLLDIRDRVSRAGEQDGLLSVALDPGFAETGHLWLYYSASDASVSRLSRFTADPDDPRRVDPGSELVVMEIGQVSTSHHGGAIRFGPDGMLYLGLGDGSPAGDPDGHGQNLDTLLGSVIRIDVSEAATSSPYAVPPDNPFVDAAGARPEIWAYGFRNPWRMAFDPATGALWAGDVGQDHVEEIDIIAAGGNYGWNRLEGTLCFRPTIGCDVEGAVPPVAVYGHNLGCAVTGGVVYRGEAIPALVGRYLFSDVCSGRLWALHLDGGDAVQIAVSPRGVSSFGVDADGEVYVLTFGGAALRIASPQR